MRGEIEDLRERVRDLTRTVWLMARAAGGTVIVFDTLAQKFDPKDCVVEAYRTVDGKGIVIKAKVDLDARLNGEG